MIVKCPPIPILSVSHSGARRPRCIAVSAGPVSTASLEMQKQGAMPSLPGPANGTRTSALCPVVGPERHWWQRGGCWRYAYLGRRRDRRLGGPGKKRVYLGRRRRYANESEVNALVAELRSSEAS